MTSTENINPNITARIAGLCYLLLVPLGIMGIIYVPENLLVSGDAAATAINIAANEWLFRISIFSALATQVVNMVVVYFLYKVLKPVNKTYALFMVIFILVAVPIAMLNEFNNFAVLWLLSGADYLSVFTSEQLQALVLFFINLHESGVIIAQVFWGLWLFPMGYLVFKSGYLPKFIGVFLMIGCFGYVLDSINSIVFPGITLTVAEFTFLGEVLLPLWLVIKGVNVEQWKSAISQKTLRL